MNPLTLVKRTQKITAIEASLGISEGASWHAKYSDSAYIFVGGIPFDLTEGDLLAVFAQYGEIVDVNLVRDKGTGKSKGFAFIAYEDQRSTILAVDNLNGASLLGRVVRVDHVNKYKKKEEEEDEESERKKREARGVCRAFQRGECTRGASCKFSHDEQRNANTGSGPGSGDFKWSHDKYEGQLKSHGRSLHADRTLGSKVEDRSSKLRSSDLDGRSSIAERDYTDRNSHWRGSEPNSKDQVRRGTEKWSDRHGKEANPHENWDRQANETRSGREGTVTNLKEDRDRRGSERCSTYDNDTTRHIQKEDRDRRGNDKWAGRRETEPYLKEDKDRQGSDKRSRYSKDSSHHHRAGDESYHGRERRR